MRTVLILICVANAGCAEPPLDHLERLFADQVRIVDLTHAVSADAPYWPGPARSPFVHDTLSAHPDGAPRMAAYAAPEHFGTHFDAPVHGGAGLASVDRVPVEDLFGPAVVLDVTLQVSGNPDYAATVEDAVKWEAVHGVIPPGAIVILRTGWSDRWTAGATYYNADEGGTLHFPGFSPALARMLVEDRNASGIGVDTGSVDPGAADGFPVHGIGNGGGAFHLENLADLTALPEAGAYLVVAPIKIEGGSGGQVRVFGIVP
jgi:kynurenine formamidase